MADGTWQSNALPVRGDNWVRRVDGGWIWEDPDWSPSPGERAAADQAVAAALEALREPRSPQVGRNRDDVGTTFVVGDPDSQWTDLAVHVAEHRGDFKASCPSHLYVNGADAEGADTVPPPQGEP